MTTSVLTFAIIFNIILANLRVEKDAKYGANIVVKNLNCAIGEYFGL